MYDSPEAYWATLPRHEDPPKIPCITTGCSADPEPGCDHCAACLEVLNTPTTELAAA